MAHYLGQRVSLTFQFGEPAGGVNQNVNVIYLGEPILVSASDIAFAEKICLQMKIALEQAAGLAQMGGPDGKPLPYTPLIVSNQSVPVFSVP